MTQLVLHLDAVYNLARWLTQNDLDAEDLAQDAYLRAFRYFPSFRGDDSKAWLLTIVRNTYYSWLKHNRVHEQMASFDEEFHSVTSDPPGQETLLFDQQRERTLMQALDELPVLYREVLVLREMEGLSYQEVANALRVPIGTVMSRLSRARRRLQQDWLRLEEAPGRKSAAEFAGDGDDGEILASCAATGI